jgi:uncharacterized protein YbbK (DUF523 family)
MAELTEKDKGGRPRKEFDEKDFKILETAIIWGSEQYCADKLEVSIPTLKTRIKEKIDICILCKYSPSCDKNGITGKLLIENGFKVVNLF